MSGGMRQRVMIAMVLSCNPKVLIADEPTTALDVTIQAQILELLRELQAAFGMAVILITHDMGVVAENADRVIVMYAGRKIEEADVADCSSGRPIPTRAGCLPPFRTWTRRPRRPPRGPDLTRSRAWCPRLCICRRAAPLRRDAASPPTGAGRSSRRWSSIGRAIWVACWHAGRLQQGAQ